MHLGREEGGYRSLRTTRLRRVRSEDWRASTLEEESINTSGSITPAVASFARVFGDDDFRTIFLISLVTSILALRFLFVSFSESLIIWVCFPRLHVDVASDSVYVSISISVFSPSPISLSLSLTHSQWVCVFWGRSQPFLLLLILDS